MSTHEDGTRLLADIGGSNARFALQQGRGETLHDVVTLPCAAFESLAAAIAHYLHAQQRSAPSWCAIAIATSITGDRVQMTNHHWSFSIAGLKAQFGFERLELINDFAALALALPGLAAHELHRVGGGVTVARTPMALIGPGTGLGVSGLLPVPGPAEWVAVQGEGGHVSLAAGSAREAAVIESLQRHFGHASAERAVSGPGLAAIHAALCEVDGAQAATAGAMLLPERITELALAGIDPRCIETVRLFCAFLGSVAGDLALTLGARGGVYIGGGIVPRLGEAFDRSAFRERFVAKGRFGSYLAGTTPDAVTDGAARVRWFAERYQELRETKGKL